MSLLKILAQVRATSSGVPVDSVDLGLQGKGSVRVLGSLPLYRVMDFREISRLADSRGRGFDPQITGGLWSVPDERKYGASFGADRDAVVQFGLWNVDSGRLQPPLFVVEFDAKGHKIGHLEISKGLTELPDGGFVLDPSICSTSLGCSVRPKISEISATWRLSGDKAHPRLQPVDLQSVLAELRYAPQAQAARQSLRLIRRATELYDEVEQLRRQARSASGRLPLSRTKAGVLRKLLIEALQLKQQMEQRPAMKVDVIAVVNAINTLVELMDRDELIRAYVKAGVKPQRSLSTEAWARKSALERVDGNRGKSMTLGTRVRAVASNRSWSSDYGASWIEPGMEGVVVDTGTADPHGARSAVRTARALRVRWQIGGSDA